MRRIAGFILTVGIAGAALVSAHPASAVAWCSRDLDGPGPAPWVTYLCPSPEDELVPQPVGIVTAHGPGYNGPHEHDWIRIRQGGRVWFVNEGTKTHEYRGAGFSTGPVPVGGATEVSGISSLAPGVYKVYDGTVPTGDLYIDKWPNLTCDGICPPGSVADDG
jgi:hypothetical protein